MFGCLESKKRTVAKKRTRDRKILNHFGRNHQNSIRTALRDITHGRRHFSFETIQRTLKFHKVFPFKILPVQMLTDVQKELRFRFVSRLIIWEQDRDAEVLKKNVWTDEATFTTSGMYNRHNNRYWSIENPRQYRGIKKQGRTFMSGVVFCATE